jgi:hypothetical protein
VSTREVREQQQRRGDGHRRDAGPADRRDDRARRGAVEARGGRHDARHHHGENGHRQREDEEGGAPAEPLAERGGGSGAPAAAPALLPANTIAIPRPTRSGGTMRATYGAISAHTSPCATPPTMRAPTAIAKVGLTASSTLLATKAIRPASSSGRRGSRAVRATSGMTLTTMTPA